MSKITDFYGDVGQDAAGRTLREVLAQNFFWMEAEHDYIQWLFPNREPSNFNPDAPLLTDEDVAILSAAITAQQRPYFDNFHDAIDKWLAFLGIKVIGYFNVFDGFELTEDFEDRKYTWLEFNHNALRITRFFHWLRELDYGSSEKGHWHNFGLDLLVFMQETAAARGVVIGAKTLNYWQQALGVA
jgi:hypothetical protein